MTRKGTVQRVAARVAVLVALWLALAPLTAAQEAVPLAPAVEATVIAPTVPPGIPDVGEVATPNPAPGFPAGSTGLPHAWRLIHTDWQALVTLALALAPVALLIVMVTGVTLIRNWRRGR